MLSEMEYKKYTIFEHQLSQQAREYITTVRTSEPSRMVGTQARTNLSSWLPSTLMNQTISLESKSAEFSFVMLGTYLKWFIEIWDQPEPEKVYKTNKNGVKYYGSYTPDFLILKNEGPVIVEVKLRSEVNKLIEKNPIDWIRLDNGEAVYVPAMERFKELGLAFKVFEYDSSLRYQVANISLLLGSREARKYSVEFVEEVDRVFKNSFCWILSDLKKELGLGCYTYLVQLIDDGVLKVDIKNDLITQFESCVVTRSEELLAHSREAAFSKQIYTDNLLTSVSIAKVPSEREAEAAIHKLERINRGEKSRSVRRWIKQKQDGQNQQLTEFQALLPSYYLKGNRRRKVNKVVDEYLTNYLSDVHASASGISIYRSFINYKSLARKEHLLYDPVCRKTFTRRIAKIPAEVIALKRGGKRMANAVSAPSDPLVRGIKAQTSWERAAIDHYLADIYLIYYSVDGKVYVERPWVTAMIDLYSTSVLAVSISFLSPSRRSVAKVMRECVRKFGKLPREIIVDRGSDFRSVYYSSLLAHYQIINTLRPSAHSRYGGEVEGLFGEFKKQWLTQREGNIADYKEARSFDGKKSPAKSAILSPKDFYRELLAFCAWRDNKCKGSGDESAAVKFHHSQNNFPFIAKEIEYNDEFLLATSVETTTYSIDFQRGINIRGSWFWSPEIKKIQGHKKELEVRIDPENPHVIFSRIDNNWHPCYSSEINTYSSKNHIAQLMEGLTKYEVANLKLKVREQDDLELVRIKREMDDLAKDEKVIPIVEVNIDFDSQEECEDVNQEQLKFSEVKPYKRESWG